MGILGDWENPYTTMAFDAEAVIVSEFQKFVMDGSLYRGSKPVMWSVVEKTALAEAEVEYEEHVSPTIFVKFPVAAAPDPSLTQNSYAVIWTTTPWTLPGNRAMAYAENLTYGVYQAGDDKLVLCNSLADQVMQAAGIDVRLKIGLKGEPQGED